MKPNLLFRVSACPHTWQVLLVVRATTHVQRHHSLSDPGAILLLNIIITMQTDPRGFMHHVRQKMRMRVYGQQRSAFSYPTKAPCVIVLAIVLIIRWQFLLFVKNVRDAKPSLETFHVSHVARTVMGKSSRAPSCTVAGNGILMALGAVGSTPDKEKEDAAVRTVLATAKSLRALNHRLPLVLVTDMELALEDAAIFDCILPPRTIQDDQVHDTSDDSKALLWQLSLSPFNRTLVVPIDTIVCDDISPIFSLLDEYDILVAPSLQPPHVDPSSIMAFRMGEPFEAFAGALLRILPLASGPVALDLALRALDPNLVHAGVLPANWRLTFPKKHVLGSHAIAHSLVLSRGPLYSVAASQVHTASHDVCELINSHQSLDRGETYVLMYGQNGRASKGRSLASVASLAECSKTLSPEVCSQEGMLWAQGDKPTRFGEHSTQHRVEVARIDALHSRLETLNLSCGVSYFGYSTDPERLVRYIAEVEKSAWGLKLFNPRTRVALFTNLPMTPRPPFDDIVHMNDDDIKPVCCKRNASWNILARVEHHWQSPYNLTVQIDSDRVVHGDISPLFEWLADDYDVLGVSGGNLPDMDLGVFGLRKNERTEALLQAWVTKMKRLGHEGVDDQYSFTRVRDRIPGLRVGFLNPRWQMKYAPPRPFSHALCNNRHLSVCNVTHTLVMQGDVMIAAGSYTSLDKLISSTQSLNRKRSHSARVVVHDLVTDRYKEAATYEECVELTRNQCEHPELDWLLPDYDILNLTEIKNRYPTLNWDVK
jgi:hypothetical protein